MREKPVQPTMNRPDTNVPAWNEAAYDRMQAKRAKKNHLRRNRAKRKPNRSFFRRVRWAMVVLIGLLLGRFLVWWMNDFLAVNRPDTKVTIEIPTSVSDKETTPSDIQKMTDPAKQKAAEKQNKEATREVAQILKQHGVIEDVDFFCLYSSLRGADGRYHNGSWQLSQKTDYEALTHLFRSDEERQDVVKLTIPEGRNALEIAQMLVKEGVITNADDFLNELNTSDFDSAYTMVSDLKNLQGRYYKLEGYLFPDTYTFYKNESPQDIVQKFLDNANTQFTQEIRDAAQKKGMTLDQLLTLASIIQAEAANKDDMYNVSSVLNNRLQYGDQYDIFHLDCDSTTYYPYRNKDAVPADKRETYKSTYDTYTIEGLPAGPICNPGLDAIDAALNPNDTAYFYFCHNPETGEAYYAETPAGHEANLEKAGLK